MSDLLHKKINMYSLIIFRNLLKNKVIQKFVELLDNLDNGSENAVYAYAEFTAQLFKNTVNFSDYILTAILEDENLYMLKKAQNEEIDQVLETCLTNELHILESICNTTSTDIKNIIGYNGFLADWKNTEYDFQKIYKERIENISKYGYGIFAKYHVFMIDGTTLVPVKNPDETQLCTLSGYSRERKAVIDNTLALIHNKPAANVLLYGHSGTGKSSTVKAVANEYKDLGLRLIELKKNQLHQIPNLIDTLNKNPLKFILFIDDLSFTQNDDNFAALKAILEGSVSAKASNIVVYATSNRMHLIKETFSDRSGDDVHANDTIEELSSLSERFGLRITFYKPDKDLYLEIVTDLARQYEIDIEEEKLAKQAETYAISRGGRSARTAKHFIEYLKTMQ